MSAHQSTQWFWSDWLGDQGVRRLTLAERGLWIDLLALAAVGSPTGYVCDGRGEPISNEEIARLTNATPKEVAKLINGILEKGVGSRDRTGRIFNRRMVRQAEMTAKKKRAGKLGGDQTKLKWQSFQSSSSILPQHLPGHVPRQMLGHRNPDPNQSTNITSSFSVAAREAESVFFVIFETPEWHAHQGYRKENAMRPLIPTVLNRDGVEYRGAKVPYRTPPGYDEATGERIAPPENEENAA